MIGGLRGGNGGVSGESQAVARWSSPQHTDRAPCTLPSTQIKVTWPKSGTEMASQLIAIILLPKSTSSLESALRCALPMPSALATAPTCSSKLSRASAKCRLMLALTTWVRAGAMAVGRPRPARFMAMSPLITWWVVGAGGDDAGRRVGWRGDQQACRRVEGSRDGGEHRQPAGSHQLAGPPISSSLRHTQTTPHLRNLVIKALGLAGCVEGCHAHGAIEAEWGVAVDLLDALAPQQVIPSGADHLGGGNVGKHKARVAVALAYLCVQGGLGGWVRSGGR